MTTETMTIATTRMTTTTTISVRSVAVWLDLAVARRAPRTSLPELCGRGASGGRLGNAEGSPAAPIVGA